MHDRYQADRVYTLMSPNADSLVFPSTANLFSIRTPVHREYLVAVAGEVDRELARSHIPHFQRGVLG